MSGGTFDYKQFMLSEIAEEIERAVYHNDDPPGDSCDEPGGMHLRPATLSRMALAAATCRLAQAMATRVDWLMAGADGEDTFHERWRADVQPLACKRMAAAVYEWRENGER